MVYAQMNPVIHFNPKFTVSSQVEKGTPVDGNFICFLDELGLLGQIYAEMFWAPTEAGDKPN